VLHQWRKSHRRNTKLTAVQDVSFPDAKDGMLGLRVAHEWKCLLCNKEYKDDKGNITKCLLLKTLP